MFTKPHSPNRLNSQPSPTPHPHKPHHFPRSRYFTPSPFGSSTIRHTSRIPAANGRTTMSLQDPLRLRITHNLSSNQSANEQRTRMMRLNFVHICRFQYDGRYELTTSHLFTEHPYFPSLPAHGPPSGPTRTTSQDLAKMVLAVSMAALVTRPVRLVRARKARGREVEGSIVRVVFGLMSWTDSC